MGVQSAYNPISSVLTSFQHMVFNNYTDICNAYLSKSLIFYLTNTEMSLSKIFPDKILFTINFQHHYNDERIKVMNSMRQKFASQITLTSSNGENIISVRVETLFKI